jgi:Mini-chromosome maintenance replisome factor
MYPLSLTISHFPSPSNENTSTLALFHVLSQILPIVSVLPLSLDLLNNTSFYPESKDEDLHSGWLQHPKGSVIICTEGGVSEGSIAQKGMVMLRCIYYN